MKFLVALPLVLSVASCYYAPHDPGYPPYYGGGDAYGPPPRPPGALPQYGPGADRPLPPARDFDAPPPRIDEQPPAPNPPRQSRPTYPTAERTDKPNVVLSPYAPYNAIDVSEFKSGDLAKDPSNGKIFRVP